MFLYLDESGDLGFNFCNRKTSRYLVIGLLVFPDGIAGVAAHTAMLKAVKRTLKNKLPKYTAELKGNKLSLAIKKYFLKGVKEQENWRLYMAIADKKAWLSYHSNQDNKVKKKILYDEIAKRLFFHVDNLETASNIDLIIDCSKNKNEILAFDDAINAALAKRLSKNSRLSIRHRSSQEEAGLQAIDLFCSGVSKKYEQGDIAWYKEFSTKIAVEIEYKF